MVHQIDSGGFFCLPAAVRVQRGHQICLQRLCQRLTALIFGEEHLRPMIPAVGEGILMDAQQNGIIFFGADSDPVLQIGDFFLGDGISLGVDGDIGGSDHAGFTAQKVHQVPQAKTDFQIVLTFRPAGAGYGPAVHAPVSRINDVAPPVHNGKIFTDDGDAFAAESDECKENKDGYGIKTPFQQWFSHGNHLLPKPMRLPNRNEPGRIE